MTNFTNKDIVKIFDESSIKIAEFISLLNDYKEKFDAIANQTLDNADPLCEAQECLEKLGLLLSVVIIYKNEYENEKTD